MAGSALPDDLDAWIADLDRRVSVLAELTGGPEPVVVAVQVQRDDGSVAHFHLSAGDGPARVRSGPVGAADLTLVATEAAAVALMDGSANAQACLADGSLRLRGNPDVLVRRLPGLMRIGAGG